MPDNDKDGEVSEMCGELKKWRFGSWNDQMCRNEQYFVCKKHVNAGEC